VLGKSPLAALLLTSMIEWFTQLHYVEHVRDSAELDGVFRARLDTLLIDEVAADLTPEERERAVDELLELGGAVDALLAQQLELDIEALARSAGRSFSDAEKREIQQAQQRAYRWTFLVSGLEHPKFVGIVSELTEAGPGKIAATARALSA
jgi:hypothetical protein